jgi:hypothetical protein
MPDASSADLSASRAVEAALRADALDLSRGARLAMVGGGFVPLLHVSAACAPIVAAANGWVSPQRAIAVGLAVLYLLPPVAVFITWRGRLPPTRVAIGSTGFLRWWFAAQWQVVFNRLPWLEECLRLVPGLYSTWLRLWGARIGGFVYWSPGVAIFDRQWLRIGSRVVFGAGVRINGHAIAPDPHSSRGADTEAVRTQPTTALYLGAITVGDGTIIGAYSLLLPGCEIAPGAITPPLRTIHPFSKWAHGTHVTKTAEGLARPDV